MGKPKYDPPTNSFPYRIQRRFNLLSVPKKSFMPTSDGMPEVNPRGVRLSALRGHVSDRVHDISLPRLRKLLIQKRIYKNLFPPERLELIDRTIEAANGTLYTKLANCVIDLKKQDKKDKKKRSWTETDWKKHMDYISQIAGPKKDFTPPPTKRGPRKPLKELLPRINQICHFPSFKEYRRLSQESWYRNPMKVSPSALKYVISDRVKKLAAHRVIPQDN